jgi:hypothetical protein
MENNDKITEYARKLFDKVKNSPISVGVEKRIKYKIEELKKFLIEQNYENESNDHEFLLDVACLSEVGYSMRQQISEPLVTTIKVDNGCEYGFSISPFKGTVFPYDVISIGIENEDHIIFIFDIEILIGGHINGVPVEYKSKRYNK